MGNSVPLSLVAMKKLLLAGMLLSGGLGAQDGLAQTRSLVAGQTYQAKMSETCTKTIGGGCWETFFYRLRFGRDSVAVTWIVQEVCRRRDQPATTRTDTTQTHRYAYYVLENPLKVAIPGFQPAPLALEADGLTGQRPFNNGKVPVRFKLAAAARRP